MNLIEGSLRWSTGPQTPSPAPQPPPRNPAARRRARPAALGADPLARAAPPRAHPRRTCWRSTSAPLPALRLRRQRCPDRPLRRHHRLRAGRGVRHLQPPARTDRHGAPGLRARRRQPRPSRERRVRRLGAAEGAPPRLRPRACSSMPMLHARNRGVASLLHPCAEREHGDAARSPATPAPRVERDGPESEAWLSLPPDSLARTWTSSWASSAAELDYRLKQQAHQRGATCPNGRTKA